MQQHGTHGPTDPAPVGARAERVAFVDELRGFAVVLMILWHTADGWLVESVRETVAWEALRLIAGLGAPLFLLVAGAAVALGILSKRTDGRVSPNTVRALLVRGGQILLLGYLLRVQMWLIDSGGLTEPGAWRAWLPLTAGLGLALYGLRRGRHRSTPGWMAAAIAVLLGCGVHQLYAVVPHRSTNVLRVDILQAIGLSIALVTLAAHKLRLLRHPVVAFSIGVAIAFATPLAAMALPNAVPDPLAAYLAEGSGGLARFPLLPWASYVFVGAGVGTLWSRARQRGRLTHVVVAMAVFGAVAAVLTSESVPHGYRLVHEAPVLAQPLRVVHKVGFVLVLSGGIFALGHLFGLRLRNLGRASLVIYWLHLELAFGMLARPVDHALPPWAWALGCAGTLGAMEAVARIRLRLWPSISARLRSSFDARTVPA